MTKILVIDDEQSSCRTLKLHFEGRGFEVETAGGAEEGLAHIQSHSFDLVISDIRMPGRDGFSLLQEVHETTPDLPVIMITAFQDLDSTIAAMHGGAVDYVPKPIDLDELEAAVDKAIAGALEHTGEEFVLESGEPAGALVGRSAGMQEIFKLIGIASQNRVTVLVQGESGSGKETVARAIHNAGANAGEPFVTISCSSPLENFLENELFRQENGGEGSRIGKIELAGEGSLFFDEVEKLSPHHQGKLLRLLEDREYTPTGMSQTKQATCRYFMASNVGLADEVAAGRFREDLFYRLGVFSITVPPLKDRSDDIPLLVDHLFRKINNEAKKNITRIPADFMDLLVAHDWPGNVRQLENVLMKAVVVASGDSLNVSLLPDEIISGEKPADTADTNVQSQTLKELEREHIQAVLIATGWHKGKACKILGISRPRLERRIAEFGFSRDT